MYLCCLWSLPHSLPLCAEETGPSFHTAVPCWMGPASRSRYWEEAPRVRRNGGCAQPPFGIRGPEHALAKAVTSVPWDYVSRFKIQAVWWVPSKALRSVVTGTVTSSSWPPLRFPWASYLTGFLAGQLRCRPYEVRVTMEASLHPHLAARLGLQNRVLRPRHCRYLGPVVLCCGGRCPGRCRRFNSTPGLTPLTRCW